ncbi:hypothetical protein JCM6882_003740 [Rhodosporidiobolus microsporus]
MVVMVVPSARRDGVWQLVVMGALCLVSFSLTSFARTSSGDAFSSRLSSKALHYFSSQDPDVERFSWHQCIGGGEWGNSGEALFGGNSVRERHCRFSNVCVRLLPLDQFQHDSETNTTVELTYYKSPMLLGGPEIWSTTQDEDKPWLMTDRDHFLTKRTVYEAMPRNVRFVEEPTVLMGSFWPHNFGHALGDDLFPAYRLLRNFDLVRPDNYYVFHQSCRQRGGDVGCENAKAIASTLSTHEYQHVGGDLFPDTETTTCFADVVMGPATLSMRHVDERSWPEMVKHMKKTIGLQANKPLKKHKVVVIRKNGRRTWLNYQEVQEHIEQTYGVETLLVDPARLTVPEQLALLDETTVMVTPPGGVSFSSTFLHKNAVAIYAEWWSEAQGRSFPMDQEVYTWNPDIHPLFYPLSRSDLSLDRSAIDPQQLATLDDNQIAQGYSNITISLPRLDLYLRTAFAHASKGMGMRLPPGLRA